MFHCAGLTVKPPIHHVRVGVVLKIDSVAGIQMKFISIMQLLLYFVNFKLVFYYKGAKILGSSKDA